MADEGILCTGVQVTAKAGLNASATALVEAALNSSIKMAEGMINSATEYNWNDDYSTLNSDVQGILNDAAASLAAIDVINYDPTRWSVNVAAYKRDTLWTRYQEAVKILREIDKGAIFVQDA